MANDRRSKRLPLNIPVRVYGRTPDNRPFRDESETKAVSVHGGLITLSAPVSEGQTLRVVNRYTEEERECRVVFVDRKNSGKHRVGLAFLERGGDFWHVYTPVVELISRRVARESAEA